MASAAARSAADAPPTGGAAAVEASSGAGADGARRLSLKLEMSGGLELLFGKVKRHEVDIDIAADAPDKEFTMKHLIAWVRDNMLKERPELFVSEDTVRPGILVLINDVDWELEGTLAYEIEDGDEVAFISTLHGG